MVVISYLNVADITPGEFATVIGVAIGIFGATVRYGKKTVKEITYLIQQTKTNQKEIQDIKKELKVGSKPVKDIKEKIEQNGG